MDLPEIPLDLEETETGFQLRLFTTQHTGLAAVLYAIAEVKPVRQDPVRAWQEDGRVYYCYYFEPSPIAERLAYCYRHHAKTVELNRDHWFSRVLDVLHNRQRLIELAHAPQLPGILRKGRRLYFEPRLSGQKASGRPGRQLLAGPAPAITDLDQLAVLLAADLPLHVTRPLTIGTPALCFNFHPSRQFTEHVAAVRAGDRFVATHPDDWRSYALSTLDNLNVLIHEKLPQVPIQPKRVAHEGDETRTFYLNPRGHPHE